MGRFELDDLEKKEQINASVPKKVIDKLSKRTCKEIAERAVLKEYNKTK